MPAMDGTGPMGLGPGTGFRRGVCGAGRGRGPGMYCRCGYGYGLGWCWAPVDTKEGLRTRKEFLKSELAAVEQEIENL